MPIINYFGQRQEDAEKRNQEYLSKRIEMKRQQTLEAIEDGKKAYAKNRKKNEIHDEGILSILNLYRSRYGTTAIASMLDLPEWLVYRTLQIPLLRFIAGARDYECLKANRKHRVWPKCKVICKELEDLNISQEEWTEKMIERNGLSRNAVKNMIVPGGNVGIADALAVVEYFGGNADEYFASTKEKAAE